MFLKKSTLFIMSSIPLFKIINVVVRKSKIFFWMPVTISDTPAVNPSGIKILLANGLSPFFIHCEAGFSNGPGDLPRNPLDCIILDN